ncbi:MULTISPECIES: MarR family winged helix-turn-helix transcriptional regulator [unclassified Brevibacterium]|uniref:MarR family winged helix-turn-helix transcriptional regulator n=1 Tax=unclassified Brevibacterium TaxID=2614124 RepID=UPI001091BCBE|nr:MarR family transcriptional regulator [Brevibacterium sp. S22]TGD27946.1 MarR family transcriptional regulator [Brevibacterium sp. S22]
MNRADSRASERNPSDSDPVAFTADELETWSSIATLLEWLPAALDAQMQRDSQISHFEYGILFALSQAKEETLAMKILAGFANSTLSRLSRAVARLERQGWVTRCPDPDDGRTTIASLTESGRTVMHAATPEHVAFVRHVVFGSLTPGQARALGRASRRITSAIREDGSWRP